MTRDEALSQLNAIRERQGSEPAPNYLRGVDTVPTQIKEDDHVEADAILLDLIDDDEISEAYHAIGKWYA